MTGHTKSVSAAGGSDRKGHDKSPDKREAILEAALALFAERGFHGTAVPLLAQRAGVGAGTIYRYFENKEALVNAVFQRWKSEMGRMLMADFPTSAPPRAQFAHLWRRLIAFAVQHPTALAFLELHHHISYLDEDSRALEDRVLGPAKMIVAAMRRAQVVKDLPPELLIALVLGAFHGLVRASWCDQLELDEAAIQAAETCCWEAIRR